MTARIIATNPAYNLFLNNMTKTVLLSQLVYWDDRKSLKRRNELWFAKTSAELAREICHPSAKSVGDWLREFREMGIIKTMRGFFNGTSQLWIQVNHDRLNALLAEHGFFQENISSPTDDHLPENNLAESELTATTKLPETDLPPPLSYPTGNCISEITNHKKSDQIDNDFISKYLSQIEINEITQRVAEYINSQKLTGSPIRNSKRYLQVSLENEAKQVKAKKESHISSFTSTTWEELGEIARREREARASMPAKEPKPLPSDELWDATLVKMQEKWDEANFRTWLKDNWFMSKTEDKYIVAVPNAFVCDMLQFRLYDEVKIALSELAQRDLEIEFRVQKRSITEDYVW